MECTKSAVGKKPAFVFIRNAETEKSGKKTLPTKPAQLSEKIATALDDQLVRIGLRYFDCYTIDATGIQQAAIDQAIHKQAAPIVAVLDRTGKVLLAQSGLRIQMPQVNWALASALRPEGIDLPQLQARASKLLNRLYDIEKQLIQANDRLTEARAKQQKRDTGAAKELMARTQKDVDTLSAEKERIAKEFAEFLGAPARGPALTAK